MDQIKSALSFSKYSKELSIALDSIDKSNIDKLTLSIKKALLKKYKIIILGNGGSAANATHIAGDYMKTFGMLGYKPNLSTPSDNLCFITAVSNDSNYNDSFQIYLESVIEPKSLIIYLSGSGNSINLIKSLNSQSLNTLKGIETWSISAYKGGKISKLTKYWLHLPTLNMEIAEDIQLIIFHYIKQKLYFQLSNKMNLKNKYENNRFFKRTILNEVS